MSKKKELKPLTIFLIIEYVPDYLNIRNFPNYKMASLTDGNWKVGYNRMVVAVSLEGVSAEAARTYGGGRIICKFFHSADGELIASAPKMKRELELLKCRLQNGQDALLAAANGPEAMISIARCLEAFGLNQEQKDDYIPL